MSDENNKRDDVVDESKQYFAAIDNDEKLLQTLLRKVEDYSEYLNSSGLWRRLKKSYRYYYGISDKGNFDSTEIGRGGRDGSLALIKVNHYRNNIQHVLTMTTSQRPAMETRASNTDYEAQVQTILGDGLLDFYMREKRLEKKLKDAVEMALVLTEGFIELEWDATLGNDYMPDPETQEMIKDGDIKINVHTPLSVIRDFRRQNDEHDWYIIATPCNKFDLIAQYPEHAEELHKVNEEGKKKQFRFSSLETPSKSESDQIMVYKFMHRLSPSLPDGRLVTFVNDKIKLTDGPLPIREEIPGGLPIYCIKPSSFIGSTFGYTPGFDLLSVQEALDALYSTVITNQTTFGVQNIMSPKGGDVNWTELGEGLNLIEYNSNMPEPKVLELLKTPQEIFNFIPQLESVGRLMIGLNDVVVGDPQSSLKSGSALALVASQAIQFNSGLQQSWAELIENTGLCLLLYLKQFANTERVAAIVGKHNRPYLKTFKGDDLQKINRVVVDMANPLSRTSAGRLEQANNLLNAGSVDATQYLSVVATGKLENLTENRQSQLLLIREENEAMREGRPIRVLATDAHAEHVKEHRVVLDSPDARQNPQLAGSALQHIQEHINALRATDPALLSLLGEQSLMMMPPGPQMGGQQGPQGGPMPEGPPPEKIPERTMNGPVAKTPNMPNNPMTGNDFNNGDGGL